MAEVSRHRIQQIRFIAKNDFLQQFEITNAFLLTGVGGYSVGSLLAIEHILQSPTDQLNVIDTIQQPSLRYIVP